MMIQGADIERFLTKVDFNGPKILSTACWVWQGTKQERGYGNFWHADQMMKAHHFLYILAHGPIPAGLIALHGCDNPSCVNPAHIRAGTPGENVRDCFEKGRQGCKGKRHGSDVAAAVRADIAAGMTRKAAAAKYGMCHATIRRIIYNRRLKDMAG